MQRLISGDVSAKRCTGCGVLKSVEDFGREKRCRDGLRRRCKECTRAENRRYYKANPERFRELKDRHRESTVRATRAWRRANVERTRHYDRAKRYGLSPAQYDALMVAQQGCCAICGSPSGDRLRIDHDHATGVVRGLLCDPCNWALGFMRDDPMRLLAAARYLDERRA